MGKYKCMLKLFFESDKLAGLARDAVNPELSLVRHRRSETKIKVNKGVLSLNIIALDAVAMRASLNSVLKLIGLVQKTLEVE